MSEIAIGLKMDQRGEYGKPSASKEARSVWNGGKAARPYLSLHTYSPQIDIELFSMAQF